MKNVFEKHPNQIKKQTEKQQHVIIDHHVPMQSVASPRNVPKTTSKMIGWLSSDRSFHLEKYGSYSKGKLSITKRLRWPNEGCE
jgi:hypothetical protein